MTSITCRAFPWLTAGVLAAILSACGGGSGSDQCSVIDPTRNSALPSCAAATAPGTPVAAGTLTLALADAAGAAITAVTPQRPGVLQAQLRDSKGNAVSGVAVAFSTSDKTASLVPASGTALTDAGGVARIGVAAGAQAGGFTLTATANLAAGIVTGTLGYTVSFPPLSFSALRIAPASLAAGGTASLAVTVLDGALPFTPAQSVSFTSPCAAAGKAIISSPVATVAGVASTSYTDKGCGAADTITATTTLAGATISQAGRITVLGAMAGQLAFVSALPQNIAMKGTGGPGRQESSTVTFKVLDKNGNPVAGAPVSFVLFGNSSDVAGTGGLTLNPAHATSGADGTVATTLLAGIVNTPVRVTATIAGSSPVVTSTSDQLVISTGIPDQKSFSLSTAIYNVEGANFNGCASNVGSVVTVSLADHFNNPVPDGTAVSFTAEGGVIDASCLTGASSTQLTNGAPIVQKGVPGQCSVRFCSQSPRVADGRVTILAYALGEESYIEQPDIKDGINRYDASEVFQDLCEPVRYHWPITDDEANRALTSAVCRAPAAGEAYIDTNGDGSFNASGDGQYNGVLKLDASGQTVASNRVPTVHVRAALVQVLSGSSAAFNALGPTTLSLSHCTDGVPFANVAQLFTVAVRDDNPTVFAPNTLPGNILPAGTHIDFSTSNGTIVSVNRSFVVPNTNMPNSGAWTYQVLVQSDATQSDAAHGLLCTNTVSVGDLAIKVTTPQNVVTGKTYLVTD